MLFAAGLGTRLGELTRNRPKPLIEVAGRALIDRALDITEEAGIGVNVVNAHYQAEILIDHLATRKGVAISLERPEVLDTGGGLRRALPMLGTGPVFTLNTDCVWKGPNPLLSLSALWHSDSMGALLMLVPISRAVGYKGSGDFLLCDGGLIQRCQPGEAGLVYTGAQAISTKGLEEFGEAAFSLNRVWDRMLKSRSVFGVVYPGRWADAGTPAGLQGAEQLVASVDRNPIPPGTGSGHSAR